MDDSLVLAILLLGPFGLGVLLRLKGAFLAAICVAGYAAGLATDGPSSELVGALVLGAGGGFALGWAGSLSRRLLRSP